MKENLKLFFFIIYLPKFILKHFFYDSFVFTLMKICLLLFQYLFDVCQILTTIIFYLLNFLNYQILNRFFFCLSHLLSFLMSGCIRLFRMEKMVQEEILFLETLYFCYQLRLIVLFKFQVVKFHQVSNNWSCQINSE